VKRRRVTPRSCGPGQPRAAALLAPAGRRWAGFGRGPVRRWFRQWRRAIGPCSGPGAHGRSAPRSDVRRHRHAGCLSSRLTIEPRRRRSHGMPGPPASLHRARNEIRPRFREAASIPVLSGSPRRKPMGGTTWRCRNPPCIFVASSGEKAACALPRRRGAHANQYEVDGRSAERASCAATRRPGARARRPRPEPGHAARAGLGPRGPGEPERRRAQSRGDRDWPDRGERVAGGVAPPGGHPHRSHDPLRG